jgi:uncharacterized protein
MVGMLLTAMTAAAAAFAQPAPLQSPQALPKANPALWMLQDSDTTVYLFGTFHTLDGRSEWFNGGVQAAFTASDELILETLLPKLDQRPAPVPPYALTPSASFIGATRMAVRAARNRGLDVHKGADMVLRSAAERAGKPVRGLESIQFQIAMLGRMAGTSPPAKQRVRQPRPASTQSAELMAQMQDSWNRGDQRMFAELLDGMRRGSPDNYRIMFPERNAHWANWIANRMERPGTVFMAVGAGHFAGPDSVLAMLSSKGFVATRIG